MIIALKLIMVLAFAYCYQEGGQGFKLMRKVIGPSILAGLIILILVLGKALSVLAVIGAILYFAAANGFSYGDQYTQGKTWKKVLFRGLCGASYGLCGLLVGLSGHWVLGASQMILAILGAILLGVLNPFPSSWGNWATRAEDVCIAVSYVVIVPLLI